jgi:hypothetical protein
MRVEIGSKGPTAVCVLKVVTEFPLTEAGADCAKAENDNKPATINVRQI